MRSPPCFSAISPHPGKAVTKAPRRGCAELGLDADLAAEPERYPGPVLPFPAVLLGSSLMRLPVAAAEARVRLAAVLRHWGAVPLELRRPVIAYASNACPGVLATKLARAGAPATLPALPAVAEGLFVGYSAHVSRSGFVPAAALPRPGARAAVVVLWLDRQQLAAVDATEPNYVRRPFPGAQLTTCLGPVPGTAGLYVSRHGVVRGRDAGPVPFDSQRTAVGLLAATGALPAGLAGDPAAATRALGRSPALRIAATRALLARGHAEE
jgi:hypothetical protein